MILSLLNISKQKKIITHIKYHCCCLLILTFGVSPIIWLVFHSSYQHYCCNNSYASCDYGLVMEINQVSSFFSQRCSYQYCCHSFAIDSFAFVMMMMMMLKYLHFFLFVFLFLLFAHPRLFL